jgi:PTS system cellobiose-specific IIC component
MEWLGAAGMFSAIIISIVTVKLYTYIVKKGWTIKMPESVPPFIKDSFASVIPGVIITSIFLIISAIFTNTQYGSMHGFIYNMFQIPLQNLGGNFGALIIVSIISQVLWVMGVHGSMVALSVMSPIWRVLDTAQLTAYSAGNPLPNIIGMNFYRVFTFGGTVLGLAILMLRARSVRFKTLGKLSIIPALFGITEPIIFGTPLVLNPLLAIPFIFGNVISLILAYIATLAGFLPKLTGISVPTGVPVGVQGLVMGGWRIAVFQLVLVLLSIALWYPFFKITDNKALKEENELVQKQ